MIGQAGEIRQFLFVRSYIWTILDAGDKRKNERNPFYPLTEIGVNRDVFRADSSKAFNTWKMKTPRPSCSLIVWQRFNRNIDIHLFWNGTSGGWMILAWMLPIHGRAEVSLEVSCAFLFFKRSIPLFRSTTFSRFPEIFRDFFTRICLKRCIHRECMHDDD